MQVTWFEALSVGDEFTPTVTWNIREQKTNLGTSYAIYNINFSVFRPFTKPPFIMECKDLLKVALHAELWTGLHVLSVCDMLTCIRVRHALRERQLFRHASWTGVNVLIFSCSEATPSISST